MQNKEVDEDEDYDEDLFDNPPEKVEVDEDIPRNFQFVHYQNEEGDELIKIEKNDVPLNFNLVQTNSELKDEETSKIESLADTGSVPLNFRF